MPFTVDQLTSGNEKLVTIPHDASVKEALDLMIEHDFNQLPVVDSAGHLRGMVTSESILRALKHFDTKIGDLQVAHATVEPPTLSSDDDLFDLLNDLRGNYAVVIVDKEKCVEGIVTSYDTTEYFRRRAQDTMYVEDIESALKEFINAAFTPDGKDDIDEGARQTAVLAATQSDQETRKQHNKVLSHYLNAIGAGHLQPDHAKSAFDATYSSAKTKGFHDLTFGEFAQMLLHEGTWPKVCDTFNLDKNAIRRLLDQVRQTRNDLFHFRGEISPVQRDELRFCVQWLNRQRPTLTSTTIGSDTPVVAIAGTEDTHTDQNHDGQTITPVESSGDSESRYAPLAQHLQKVPPKESSVLLSFEQVEAILGGKLPDNARQHRSWWANDSVSHSQSLQWLDAGWRVNRISIADQKVSFARNREREHQYIDFFSGVIDGLNQVEGFPLKATSPGGQSWQTLAVLPQSGTQKAVFIAAFAFKGKARIELYIDTWDQALNKQIFDEIHIHKPEIEAKLGNALSWERLDAKRACRIALYRNGAIGNLPSDLDELRTWIVEMMPRFHEAIAGYAETAIVRQRDVSKPLPEKDFEVPNPQ